MKIRHLFWMAAALATPALADLPLDCARLGQWGGRGIVSDLAAETGRLYSADERGLSTFDITQPQAIRRVASATTATPSRKIAVSANAVAVLTDGAVELFSLDGATRIATLPLSGDSILSSGDLFAVIGSELVTLTVENGIPRIIGRRSAGAIVEAAALGSDVLVVRLKGRSLYFLDAQSSSLTQLASSATSASAMAIAGNRLFVADLFGSIRTFDISDPSSPAFRGITAIGGPGARRLIADDGFLFATSGDRVVVFDLASELPALHAVVNERADALASAGTTLFLAASADDDDGDPGGTVSEIHAWNIATPEPARTGEVVALGSPVGVPATDGRYAFIPDPPMFRIVDLYTSPPSEVAAIELRDGSDHVRLYGDLALVFGDGNVHMIDITQRRAPRWLGMYASLGIRPSRADFSGPYLIEANITSGFHLVDVSDPSAARHRDGLLHGGSGRYHGAAGVPGVAYVYEETGFKVVNTTNPDDVQVVGFVNIPWIQQLEVIPTESGTPLLAARTLNALHILSLANPLSPQPLARLDFLRPPAMAVTATAIYVVEAGGRLHEIDISAPSSARIARTFTVPGDTHGVAVAGSTLIITSRRSATAFDLQRLAAATSPPHLAATSRAGRGTYDLSWSGDPAAGWTIEIAEDSSFSTSRSFAPATGELELAVTRASFARARAGSCGSWSNVVHLVPDEEVSFTTSSRTAVITAAASQSMTVRVQNHSGTRRLVRLESDDLRVPLTTEVSANSHADVLVPVPAIGTGEMRLRLTGENGVALDEPFLMRLISPSPATTAIALPRAFAVLPQTRERIRRAARRSPPNLTLRTAAAELTCTASRCEVELAAHSFDLGRTDTIRLTLQQAESVRLEHPQELFPASSPQALFTLASDELDSIDIEAFSDSGTPLTVSRTTLGIGSVEAEALLLSNDDSVTLFGLDMAADLSLAITPSGAATSIRPIHLAPHQVMTLTGAELSAGAPSARLLIRSSAPYAVLTSSQLHQRAGTLDAPRLDAVSAFSGTISAADLQPVLHLENLSQSSAEAWVTLIGSSGTARRVSLTIAPAGSITIAAADLFAEDAGLLRVTSHAPLLVAIGRTPGDLRFLAEASPSRNSAGGRIRSDSARERVEATIDSRVRSIRVSETNGAPVTAELSLFDSSGATSKLLILSLAPFEVREIEAGPPSWRRIEVAATGEGGMIVEAVSRDGAAFPLQ